MSCKQCKLIISHCGWGGVMESINTETPILAFPFFGDQPTNANLIHKMGIGEILISTSFMPKRDKTYETPVFTQKILKEKVIKMLYNPNYYENIKKINNICKT